MIKDYLATENARNKENAELYVRLLKRAFGNDNDVTVGHHLTFEHHGDLKTVNEVPAADTLLTCHEIMGKAFGPRAVFLMRRLVEFPADGGLREAFVKSILDELELIENDGQKNRTDEMPATLS